MNLLHHLPRFRAARRQMADFASREDLPRDLLRAWQLEALNTLWRHATAHVPHYRRLKADARLPEAFDSLEQFADRVPILEKATVRACPESFLADDAPPGRWYQTSGSTGHPLRLHQSDRDHRQVLAAKYRFYQWHGIELGQRIAWLWSPSDSGSRAQRWMDILRSRIRLNARDLGDADLDRHLDRLIRFRPVALYGYAQATVRLARAAAERRWRCDSLRVVIVTGESSSAAQRHEIARAMGVPCVVEYGSVEYNLVAGQAPDGTLRQRADIALIETPPRPDGMHDVLLTTLVNPSFPLLRYRLGDLTARPIDWPERGLPILPEIAGRADDFLRSARGRPVHSSALDDVLEPMAPVLRGFRIHQKADGSLLAEIQPAPGRTFDPATLAGRLSTLLDGAPVDVRTVAELPPSSGGKRWPITSDLRA